MDPLEIAMRMAVPEGVTWMHVGRINGAEVLVSQPNPLHWILCEDTAHGQRSCVRLDVQSRQLVEVGSVTGARIFERDPMPARRGGHQ